MYFLLPLNVVKYMILIQCGKRFIKSISQSTWNRHKSLFDVYFFHMGYRQISSK